MKLAVGFAAVAAATAAALCFGVATFAAGDRQSGAPVAFHRATPSAAEFAHDLAGTANAYSATHAANARLSNTHCVQAAPGRYMCSFAVIQQSGSECHLIQARWTPNRASTITVTLSGRVGRCGSLREALESMG